MLLHISVYLICFSLIKLCTYWNRVTLDSIYEHAYLFYNTLIKNDTSQMPKKIHIFNAAIDIQ